jgi:hypothetical protein
LESGLINGLTSEWAEKIMARLADLPVGPGSFVVSFAFASRSSALVSKALRSRGGALHRARSGAFHPTTDHSAIVPIFCKEICTKSFSKRVSGGALCRPFLRQALSLRDLGGRHHSGQLIARIDQ